MHLELILELLRSVMVPLHMFLYPNVTRTEENNMDLAELREQIDKIDEQIVALYEQRMDVCRGVAQYNMS